MIKFLTQLSLAALFALTTPLAAQDSSTVAETESPEAAQSETDAQTSSDQGLDLGQPVGENELRLGERYSKAKHGDWDLACVLTDPEEDPCSMLQILRDQNGNPLAEFSLFRLADQGGQAVAAVTVIVPLETLLPAALTISVDGAPGKRYNYSFCNSLGCIAQIGLTASDVASFKKGSEATVSLRPAPAPDQLIQMKLSLKGFTAVYDIVDVVAQ